MFSSLVIKGHIHLLKLENIFLNLYLDVLSGYKTSQGVNEHFWDKSYPCVNVIITTWLLSSEKQLYLWSVANINYMHKQGLTKWHCMKPQYKNPCSHTEGHQMVDQKFFFRKSEINFTNRPSKNFKPPGWVKF